MIFTKKRIKRDKIGLTLMELIVGISVIGFIIVAILAFNMIGEKFYYSTSKQADVSNDAQYLIQQIGREIKEASNVVFNNGTLTISRTLWNGDVVTSTYREDGSDIYYSNPSKGINTEQLFASNVKDFQVEKTGKQVRVEIELEVVNPGTKLEEKSHYASVFTMRN